MLAFSCVSCFCTRFAAVSYFAIPDALCLTACREHLRIPGGKSLAKGLTAGEAFLVVLEHAVEEHVVFVDQLDLHDPLLPHDRRDAVFRVRAHAVDLTAV